MDDGRLPADNNWIENQIRPIAIGRSNWLFAGIAARRQAGGQGVMGLIRSAELNGHDPHAHLKDIVLRGSRSASQVDELPPTAGPQADASTMCGHETH